MSRRDGLKAQYVEFADRIYILSEMVGEHNDIPDPIGGEWSDYQEIANLLEHLLTHGLKIYQMALKHQQEVYPIHLAD